MPIIMTEPSMIREAQLADRQGFIELISDLR
jgi:hypothetical protein